MKKFVKEDLNKVLIEPEAAKGATKDAKKMGLKYVGFGRYSDPKTQQVSHVILNGKLSPFQKATKSNTFAQMNTDDYGLYNQLMQPQLDEYHAALVTAYPPEKFDDREYSAIQQFTSGLSMDVNDRLAGIPTGANANKMEPQMMGDPIPDVIRYMDSATKKSRVPLNFKCYVKIPDTIPPENLLIGSILTFKGFRTASLSLGALLATVQPSDGPTRPTVVILQIEVPKNSRGLYAADYSATPQDYEFIFCRGAKVEIASDFQTVVGSDALSNNLNLEVLYADCILRQ